MQREIKLGLVTLVALIGTVMGLMVVVYVMAFGFGQESGYAAAMQERIPESPKFPIVDNGYKENKIDLKETAEVYAQLPQVNTDKDSVEERQMPNLTDVKSLDEEPAIPEFANALLDESNESPKKKLLAQDGVEHLKETLGAKEVEDRAMLGDLLAREQRKIEEVKQQPTQALVKSTPTPTPTTKPTPTVKLTVAPAPVIPSRSAPIKSGWYAQLGALENLSEAQALANRVKDAGFPVTIEEATVKGSRYFRVLTGPEKSKLVAERLIDQMVKEKIVKERPFPKLIK